MLSTVKNVTLTGRITIDGTLVATAHAASGNNFTVTSSIQNKELYLANKEQVQADLEEFNAAALALVDESTDK